MQTHHQILLSANGATRVSVNDAHVDINTQLTLATIIYSSVNSASANASILCLYDQRVKLMAYWNINWYIIPSSNSLIYWSGNTPITQTNYDPNT